MAKGDGIETVVSGEREEKSSSLRVLILLLLCSVVIYSCRSLHQFSAHGSDFMSRR